MDRATILPECVAYREGVPAVAFIRAHPALTTTHDRMVVPQIPTVRVLSHFVQARGLLNAEFTTSPPLRSVPGDLRVATVGWRRICLNITFSS